MMTLNDWMGDDDSKAGIGSVAHDPIKMRSA